MSFLDRFIPGRGQAAHQGSTGGGEPRQVADAGTHINIGARGRQQSLEQILGGVNEGLQGHSSAAILGFISPDPDTGIASVDIVCDQQGLGRGVRDQIVQLSLNQALGVTTPLAEQLMTAIERKRAEEAERAEAERLVQEWGNLPRSVRIRRMALGIVVRSAKASLRPFTISAEMDRLAQFEPEDTF